METWKEMTLKLRDQNESAEEGEVDNGRGLLKS